MASGADTHTHTHAHICTEVISRNQARAWFKKFKVTFDERSDYSGILGTPLHQVYVNEVLKHTTKTAQQTAESQYGVRYSALLQLPYFDAIEYTACIICSWEQVNMYVQYG